MIRIAAILSMIFFSSSLIGQNSMSPEEISDLGAEVSILADSLVKEDDGGRRMAINAVFVQKFGEFLTAPEFPEKNMDSLPYLSILTSPDRTFRIYTWEVEDESGSFHYYGYVRNNKEDQRHIVFQLKDSSAVMGKPAYNTGKADRWYGALYYDMREVNHKKERYYVFLGINRSRNLTKERIVETAWVDDELYFGKEVFQDGSLLVKKRLLYPHSVEASMTLLFDEEDNIVVDHLSPSSPAYEGKFQYYVPDLSYDAWLLKKGRWNYKEDHDARLDPNLKDRFYEMELKEQKKAY